MKRPNVLFIIVDQWSTRCANGRNNAKGVLTPGLTRLRDEGMCFENSYSVFPLCCPSRASFFTGMYPQNHNINDNEEIIKIFKGSIPKRADLPTMGQYFKQAGYKTAYFGKEHAGGYGWDHIDEFGSLKYTGGGMLAEGSAYDQFFTKDAVDYLKQEHDQPFYMTLSLINPHDICKVIGGKVKGATFADAIFFCRDDSEPYLRNQSRADLPINHDAPIHKGMIKENDYMFEDLKDMDENAWKRYISTYHLLIEKTDWYLELILDTLKTQGLEKDTIVVFTSDHGDMMGSHGLISKVPFYEESVKTQFIIKYPEVIQYNSSNQSHLISSIDIMPTLLDLCNIQVLQEMDGKSFKKACLSKDTQSHQIVFSQNDTGRMIRHKDYKFILSEMDGQVHEVLFDLRNDPMEYHNLSHDEQYTDIKNKLKETLLSHLSEQKIDIAYHYNYNKKGVN